MQLWFIFSNILLPVLILIGIGAFLHMKFRLDLGTLAKVNMYYLVPGLILVRLYETDLEWGIFFDVLLFFIGLCVLLYVVSEVIGRLFRFSRGLRLAFSNSALFFNAGNYGIPVNDLAFRQDPAAMAVQVMIVTFQNLLVYSYGVITLQRINKEKLAAGVPYFKMPVLYAMVFGIGLNVFNVTLPPFLYIPGSYIADALVGMALLTLGAQVAQLNFTRNMLPVYVSVAVRLLVSPLLALLVIPLLDVNTTTAQAMFIASAVPSSVNSAIVAQEYNNEPAFAAQAVLASTVFSVLTMTLVIYSSSLLFT